MTSTARAYKSTETVIDSSSDDESPPNLTLLQRSPSASTHSSRSVSPSTSSPDLSPSATPSPSRSASPDPSSYQYNPPSTHTLSTSREKSALPSLRLNDELFLARIPRGLSLKNMQFNFRKRKVRIEDEEWKILDLETKDVRMIQAKENSERFEFGGKGFSMGLNVVRDVRIPGMREIVDEDRVENLESAKKKRKREGGEGDGASPQKHKEKKHREEKHDKHDKHKDKNHKKEKKDKERKEERKEKHKQKDRHDKGEKHRH